MKGNFVKQLIKEAITTRISEIDKAGNEAAKVAKLSKIDEDIKKITTLKAMLTKAVFTKYVGVKELKAVVKNLDSSLKELDKAKAKLEKTKAKKLMEDFNIKQFLTENKLTINSRQMLKEGTDGSDILKKAGHPIDDGLLGGVGSGGAGYYDGISDKISGYNLDKFDEEEFNKWYDNFSLDSFNKDNLGDGETPLTTDLPNGFYEITSKDYEETDYPGTVRVEDGNIILYAYPTLSDESNGSEEFKNIFRIDSTGKIIQFISKEDLKSKLQQNIESSGDSAIL